MTLWLLKRPCVPAGLDPATGIIPDGKLHRLRWSNERRGRPDGFYVLHLDGPRPAGAFGCWKRGIKETWSARGRPLSSEERRQLLARADADRTRHEQAERRRHEHVAQEAAAASQSYPPAPPDHAYLAHKGVGPHGIRVNPAGRLVVPAFDAMGKLWTLQTIVERTKLYRSDELGALTRSQAHAHCHRELAATIHEATGLSVAVAFDAGNLQPAAEALRASFPDADLLIAADDDHATERNPGASNAAYAAKAVGGRTVLPRFADASCRGTDFNDLAQAEGPAVVKAQIEAALGTLVPARPSETSHRGGSQVVDLATFRAQTARVRAEVAAANAHERVQRRQAKDAAAAAREAAAMHPAAQYDATPSGLVLHTPTERGVTNTPLCNFTAEISAETVRDDGAEQSRRFEIAATLSERRLAAGVGADEFAGMGWVTRELGSAAVIYAGQTKRDHVRAAIQLLSRSVERQTVYAHLGWRTIEGQEVYLHAGGALGAIGLVDGLSTDLDPVGLGLFDLPPPPEGEAMTCAVRASLSLLDLGPLRLTAMLLSTVARAPLAPADFAVYSPDQVASSSPRSRRWCSSIGVLGSTRAICRARGLRPQQPRSAGLRRQGCRPGCRRFRPGRCGAGCAAATSGCGPFLAGAGQHAGRQRMRPDGTLRPMRPPRGLIVCTGEDLPTGQSIRARCLIGEVAKGDVDAAHLTRCQADAAAGLYAQTMAAFLRWLALDLDRRRGKFRTLRDELRRNSGSGAVHARTPWMAAELIAALSLFFDFAVAAGGLTSDERDQRLADCTAALKALAAAQADHQAAEDPVRRFLDLVGAAIAAQRAHVADARCEEEPPADPAGWGWELVRPEKQSLDPDREAPPLWRGKGSRIGWLGGDLLLLNPSEAYTVANRIGESNGRGLGITERTLWKRMAEAGLLAARSGDRNTYKARIGTRTRNVIALKASLYVE